MARKLSRTFYTVFKNSRKDREMGEISTENPRERENPRENIYVAARTLKMPGLKPSDYFLFKLFRDKFFAGQSALKALRGVFTLGIRVLYSCWYDPAIRQKILVIAAQVHAENLDIQHENIKHRTLEEIEALTNNT